MAEEQTTTTSSSSSSTIVKVIRVMNIITALIIIGFGIAGIIFQAINDLTSGRFFLIFSPIFMMLFGIMIFAAECKIQCLMEHFSFLRSLIGRGIFSIYMSSNVFYYFSCGPNSNDVVGWILGSILFILGVIYLVLYCCGGRGTTKDIKEQMM